MSQRYFVHCALKQHENFESACMTVWLISCTITSNSSLEFMKRNNWLCEYYFDAEGAWVVLACKCCSAMQGTASQQLDKKVSRDLTDHCGVQEGGDVEDLVEAQCRVDAFVLLAGAEQKKDRQTDRHTHAGRKGGGSVIFQVLKQNNLLPPSDNDWKCKRR